MSPYRKGALFVIRLIASGLIFFSLIYLASDFFNRRLNKTAPSRPKMILKSLPLLAGVVLWVKSYDIAKKLTEDLDD